MTKVETKPGFFQLYNISQLRPSKGVAAEADDFVKSISMAKGPWQVGYQLVNFIELFPTEIIEKKDPRSYSPWMIKATKKDIAGLIKRWKFKVVLGNENSQRL